MKNKNIEAIYPLSAPQQGMLFETLYGLESGMHVEQFTCTLRGNINISAFKQGWERIVERHSVLRTGFVWKEQQQPLQVVLRRVEVPFEQQDWRGYQLLEQQEQLAGYLRSDRTRNFNLSQPPLMRLALFHLALDTYQFVWTHHHILMDGWCGALVIKEFLSFYQAFSKNRPLQLEPVCSYSKYIAWLKKQDLSQIETFWQKTLQGFVKPTPLGKINQQAEFPTSALEAEFPTPCLEAEPPTPHSQAEPGNEKERYGEESRFLPAQITAALKSLAKANRLTLNTIVQGIWALLLSRYSGEKDVVFGITVSGRPPDLPGIESMVGLFINTLPLRVKIAPQTKLLFWLQDIQTDNFALRQYEHSHGGQIHEWSGVPGFLPLFESILVFENYPVDLAILQAEDFSINISNSRSIGAQTKYALTLLVTADSTVQLKFVYDRRRFESADIKLILEHFLVLLNTIVSEFELGMNSTYFRPEALPPTPRSQAQPGNEILEAPPRLNEIVEAPARLNEIVEAPARLNEIVEAPPRGSKCHLELGMLLDKIPTDQIPKVRPLKISDRSTSKQVYPALRTPVEEVVAGIWTQILGLNQVSIDDNFFELGGHSLLATQVISRLREAFKVEIPLSYLFESPTIAKLASKIEAKMKAGLGLIAPPIVPVARDENLPLSFAQQRLWFLDRLNPGNITYNIPSAVRLTGSLNLTALERSLNEVFRRHEALRTYFVELDGQPMQKIAPPATFTLPIVDLRELPSVQREQKAQNLAVEEAEKPFDLARGPLLRIVLLQLDETEYVLLLTMHHIVSDLWSAAILIRELAALYQAFCNNLPSPLSELPIQYADFAVWQRQWMQGEVLATEQTYWKQQLSGALTVLKLPADKPRPLQPTSEGKMLPLVLPKELSEALKSLSQREGVTIFMSLLAAFNALLYCYTQQDDILVGSPIANRNRREIEGLIGFFINTLVLRTDLSGNPSFRELLSRVRQVTLGAYAHQDLPFEKLVGELQIERDLDSNPLFQVWFTLQNSSTVDVSLPDLTLNSFEVKKTTVPFDLALLLSEKPEGISGCFEYKTDLFAASTILSMAERFKMLLQSVVADPDLTLNQIVENFHESNRQQQLMKEQEYQNTVRHKLTNLKRKSQKL